MKKLRFCFCGLVLLGLQAAIADDAPRSIMFEEGKDYSRLTTLPENSGDKPDRCTELARQMEALRGKPQRRFAVSQQYEAECKRQ